MSFKNTIKNNTNKKILIFHIFFFSHFGKHKKRPTQKWQVDWVQKNVHMAINVLIILIDQ